MGLTNGTQLGSYEIVAPIGAGGMGEVYRARDTKLGREVALKVLPVAFSADAERMVRFRREAQLLASLNHPNIAAIYGFEDSGATDALVMELVEGPTLGEKIKVGAIAMEEALPIAKQICEALEYAHERGVVHRDLKPANIKIAGNETVKILDFGLAKALEAGPAAMDISSSPTITRMATQAGIILGTAAYMSPEQAKGKSVDRRTDIWAFGCVLYEMLTGKMAFSGETVTDTLAAVIKSEPEWGAFPANTPARIRELLQRSLKKDPRQRLQSIGDARIALEEVLSDAPTQYETAPAEGGIKPSLHAAPAPFWRNALPWTVATVALALLIAAIGYGYFASRSGSTRSVTKLDISPPDGVSLVTRDSTNLAISPDGRQVVFMGTKGDVHQLYSRSADETEAEPMAGTEDGAGPFFSPDGKWVGFFAAGKLKKVPAAGGTAQALADAPNQRGGSWTPDGTIIFSPDYTSGLMRVSETGGQPEQVALPDQSKGERTYRWPDVLPNGKGVIFTIGMSTSAASYDDAEIAVYSFADRKTRVLAHGGMARYSPQGYLLYSRAGTLSALPFNESRMENTGSSVQLSDAVDNDPTSGVAYFAVAANGTMTYLRGSSVSTGRVVVITDRKGEAHVLPVPPRGYSIPRFSPDGKRLVLTVNDKDNSIVSGEGDLWTYDFGTGNMSRLTFEGSNDYPVWSADGSTIFYDSTRGGDGSVYARRIDGTGGEQLVLKGEKPSDPDTVSSNGKIMALTFPGGAEGELRTFALGEKARPQLFKKDAGGAAFSPDGNYIAYSSYQSGVYQIFVNTFPSATGQWQVSQEGGGALPRWCNGGREMVYYDQPRNRVMDVEIDLKPAFHAGPARPLFNLSAAEYSAMQTNPVVNYDASADCQRFVFLQPSGSAQVSPQIAVTLNFPAEIRALVGKQK
ncbi:MAG TPA: protein kinase [Candidatus Acidoferrales bacterium]|nr:protein kinase [Candidatus Acidoferrales bacterium]